MQKRVLVILLILLVGTGVFLYLYKGGTTFKDMLGGKGITEGVIEYSITYPKLDPNNMMLSSLPTKAYLRFKNNNVVNDMSAMAGLFSITFISNNNDKSVKQLLSFFTQKYVSDISGDTLKQLNDFYLSSVEQGKNMQEIAGYKCKEAIVKLQNGEVIHVYYTNDIGITNPNWSNPYSKIDGVLMDFQMERYGLAMHLQAKSVLAQTVEDSIFDISDEYKKIPFIELEKILRTLSPASN